MKIGKDKRKKNQTGGVVKLVASRNYRAWINDLRKRYRAAQTKAAVSVNSALLEFYWNLGKDISEKYAATQYYGSRFFECVSKDLTDSIRNPQGLSVVNIRYCQRFYDLYSSLPNLPQLVEELVSVPWGQHRCIIDKCKGDAKKAHFYVRGTIAMGWSRSQLEDELEADLYTRKGKSVDNFAQILPPKESKTVAELVKSPYLFGLTESVDEDNERQVERALVRNITRTLTELGGGFAYVGHQVCVQVGNEEFFPDLIFYHLALRRYFVIELKTRRFKPSDLGQLGFYMTCVDRQIKHEWDGPTVGLVLCKSKDRTVVEYALSGMDRPMGVAQYKLHKVPPKELSVAAESIARLSFVVDETFAQAKAVPAKDARTSKGR